MLQGGGWCFDQTPEGVVSNCAGRATGGGGSSKYEGPTTNIGGVLSSDPTVNPHFHNWSLVFIHYCDGTSFTCTWGSYRPLLVCYKHIGDARVLARVHVLMRSHACVRV